MSNLMNDLPTAARNSVSPFHAALMSRAPSFSTMIREDAERARKAEAAERARKAEAAALKAARADAESARAEIVDAEEIAAIAEDMVEEGIAPTPRNVRFAMAEAGLPANADTVAAILAALA